MSRIVYARRDGLALAGHEILGSDDNNAWAALPPAAYLTVLLREWPHRLLWLDRLAYDEAVRSLPPDEVLRAVHFRIDTFAEQAAGSLGGPIVAALERYLSARLADRKPVERDFARMVAFVGDGAWADQPLPQLLDRTVDDVASLAAELALPPTDPDAAPTLDCAKRLALQTPVSSLPALTAERVWAAPLEPALEKMLSRMKRPHAVVGDEVLFGWSYDHIADVAPKARVVHADSSVFEALLSQTPAQQARDLKELLATPVSATGVRLDLRRHAALRLGWLAPRLGNPTVSSEAQLLRDQYLRHLSPTASPTAESTLRDDLALGIALAERAHFSGFAKRAIAALADLGATQET